MGRTTRLASRGMTHGSLLLAEALRSRRGHNAWAPCRTLVRIVRRTVGAGQALGKRLALPCLEGTGSLGLGLTKSDSASRGDAQVMSERITTIGPLRALVEGQRLDQPTFHALYEAMPPGNEGSGESATLTSTAPAALRDTASR